MSLDPFDLFCAYHLGISEENTYVFQNGPQVAQRFGVSLDALQASLAEHGLDADTVLEGGFDLAGAQVDVQLSPAGVDLRSVARIHYEALLVHVPRPRDWSADAD